MSRGQLPKAYLRLDPNADQQHPDNLGLFVRLLCAANRQAPRGHFKSRTVLEALFGRASVRQLYERRDVVDLPDGRVYVDGWNEHQEGDLTVGERMRRLRERASQPRNSTVTEPSPDRITPSVASRRLGVDTLDTVTEPAERGYGWGPKWLPIEAAFTDRGFVKKPTPKQRDLLWPIVDARPQDAGRWASEAPTELRKGTPGAFPKVVGYVLAEWDAFRSQTTPAKAETPSAPDPLEAERARRARLLEQPPKPLPPVPWSPEMAKAQQDAVRRAGGHKGTRLRAPDGLDVGELLALAPDGSPYFEVSA